MRIENYINYGMCIYESHVSGIDKYKLGDVVINKENEIGIVIQIHDRGDFRTDMFGNASVSEVRTATDKEIETYRPNIMNEGNFDHSPKPKKSKRSITRLK